MAAKINNAQTVYLDFLRASAALLVLFGHAAGLFAVKSGIEKIGFQNGAVFVFFLMSGFLICFSTISKHPEDPAAFKKYLIDRFCRIFVAYVPALALTAVMDSISIRRLAGMAAQQGANINEFVQQVPIRFSVESWFGNLFMLQGSPTVKALGASGVLSREIVEPFGSAGPFWTISIEWWIYISFGIIYFTWLSGKSIRWWQLVILVIVIQTPAYFLIGGPGQCLTLLWIVGALFAVFFKKITLPKNPMTFKNWTKGALCLAIIFVLAAFGRRLMVLHYAADGDSALYDREFQFGVFLAGAIFSFLFFLYSVERVPIVINSVVKFIAAYSYSLYLTHMQVLVFIYLMFPGSDNDYRLMIIACVAANLVAIVFWWLFERHYHKIARSLKSLMIVTVPVGQRSL